MESCFGSMTGNDLKAHLEMSRGNLDVEDGLISVYLTENELNYVIGLVQGGENAKLV